MRMWKGDRDAVAEGHASDLEGQLEFRAAKFHRQPQRWGREGRRHSQHGSSGGQVDNRAAHRAIHADQCRASEQSNPNRYTPRHIR